MTTIVTPSRHGWARLAPAAVWLLLATVTWYVLAFNPTDRIADPTGPCLWHALFGIDGPSCGGTRMYWYLLHGNLVQAARHHLVALVGLLYGGYALAPWTASAVTGRPAWIWRPGTKILMAYIVVFLLYAVVLRNLPWPPFTWFYVANLV